MSEWYCATNFPIPEGMHITMRGEVHGHVEPHGGWYYVKITEWQPEDPFYEPKPIGEEDERELTR